jgi:ceramide glucosyltransferase
LNALATAFGVLLTVLAAGYGLLAVLAQLPKRRAFAAISPEQLPAVTILKPLCGEEFELYEQLRSFCLQDHPRVQIIFGVSDASDAALRAVSRLQREFPSHDLRVVIESATRGANRKVGNLINMAPHIKHDLIVIADSDIRVERTYVSRVVAPLLDPAVGVVTCAYRARPRTGIWSKLGALFIDEWFIPSVRVATLLGSESFTSGATIALRRTVLDEIGGFAALADQLADDFEMGALARALGLRTVLSEVMVETTVDEPTLSALVRHQLRWLRTIRSVQPAGYAFSVITFTVPVSLLGVALAKGAVGSLVFLAIAITSRVVLHLICSGHDRPSHDRSGHDWRASLSRLWLLPIHDLLAFSLWCWSFAAPEVSWRRARYRVERDGSLRPMA